MRATIPEEIKQARGIVNDLQEMPRRGKNAMAERIIRRPLRSRRGSSPRRKWCASHIARRSRS